MTRWMLFAVSTLFLALIQTPARAREGDPDITFSDIPSGYEKLREWGQTQDERPVGFAQTSDGGNFAVTELPGGGADQYGFDAGNIYSSECATTLLIEDNDDILVAGDVYADNMMPRFGLMRIKANGALDHGFGHVSDGDGGYRGTLGAYFSGQQASVRRVLKVPRGYVVMGSVTFQPNDWDFAARTLKLDGNFSPNFSSTASFGIDLGGTLADVLSDAADQRRGTGNSHNTFVLVGTARTNDPAETRCAALSIHVEIDGAGNGFIEQNTQFDENDPLNHRWVDPIGPSECTAVAAENLNAHPQPQILLAGRSITTLVPDADSFGLLVRLHHLGVPDPELGRNGKRYY